MNFLLILLTFLLLLALPKIAHAKGGSSRTVAATGPKSDQLINLENQMYGISDQMMNAYTGQLPPTSGTGDRIVSSGKAGTSTGTPMTTSAGTVIPQPYDSNTMMGQLLNDATAKTYNSNQRYDDLMNIGEDITNYGMTALGNANNLLGQGVNAVNQSKTAGDWYFNQAQDSYGSAKDYLSKADTAGDWYYNNAQTDFGNAQNYLAQAGTAGDWYYNQAQGDFGNAQNYLAQAGTAGDPWYGKAWDTYGTAEGLLGQLQNSIDYSSQANQWYDDYTRGMLGNSKNLLETGQIPQPIIDAVTGMMTNGVNNSLGTAMNDLASRGIVNSSVSNRAVSDMSKSISDSLQGGYMDAFNSLLTGYNNTAQTGATAGKAFADTNLNISNAYSDAMKNAISLGDSYGATGSQRVSDLLGVASGYTNNANSLVNAGSSRVNDLLGVAQGYTGNAGALMDAGNIRVNNMLDIANGYNTNADSLMGAGSQRIGDWLNIANGYNSSAAGYGTLADNYAKQQEANLAEREQLMAAIPQYYTNAMSPMMPSYNLMQTMQQDHWNSDKMDTIVKSGK